MELLSESHIGEKMLGHLHGILTTEFPAINSAELGLVCELNNVAWWKGGALHPLQDFIDLFRYITENNAPEIGYELARQAQLTDLGMMGYSMLTAGSVRDFILVAGYALRQFKFPVDVSLESTTDGRMALNFTPEIGNLNCFDRFLEFTMALAWHYIEAILPADKKVKPLKVCFSFQPPTERKSSRTFYNTSVDYGSDSCSIVVSPDILDIPLTGGSLVDLVSCSIQCKQILGSNRIRGRYHRLVEQALIEAPSLCRFSFAETARYLEINERLLKSRLEKESASFREICMHVRMEIAKEYLKSTNFPVKQIAYLLSYSEPNNFIRAFSKYNGVSPKRFREN